MTEKQKQEVLKVFRLMLENKYFFDLGICTWMSRTCHLGIVTADEYYAIRNYLDENLPPRMENSVYCWREGDIVPRVKWIEKQIVKLENELL